jgi:hypothetical protein
VPADQHVEDHTVDLVVGAVVGDRPDRGGELPEPVDPAFPLLVSGGVPGQVVVHDGGEALLQVDPLRQAVGADQDAGSAVRGQVGDAGFTFLRGQGAGHRLHPHPRMGFGQHNAEMLGDVFRGGDVAAEHDGVEAVREQGADDGH